MPTLIKIQNKGQVTIPNGIRSKAGLVKGDYVEAAFERGKIVLTPKSVTDRSGFPNADDEYTPAQRSMIDARLRESLEEVKRGHTAGPFNTADEMIASLKQGLKKAGRRRTKPVPDEG
jgi:AbrB family looped-hinge helix DNA binding protein